MMNFVHCGSTFLNRCLRYSSHSDVPPISAKKTIPTHGDTSAKKLRFRPMPPNDRATRDWTKIAWPTNIESLTPDGKFGPAMQMTGWGDCWFLAPLAAVANDKDGQQILARSITKVDGGYSVTFKGMPNTSVFISKDELLEVQLTGGGDADTRLLELAADKFFKKNGNFKSLHIAANMKAGMNQAAAEQCYQDFCQSHGILDTTTFNPMRRGISNGFAFFLLTGMVPRNCNTGGGTNLQRRDVMSFLNQHLTNNQDGVSVVISSLENNPLGNSNDSIDLVIIWDAIRTEITRDNKLSKPELAFLNALEKWIENRDLKNTMILKSAAWHLGARNNYKEPEAFVDLLERNRSNLSQGHLSLLRSGVYGVLAGRSGYIGFPGSHSGNLEGINEATDTFTYSEPNYPELVHTGDLSVLIETIQSGNTYLTALEPQPRPSFWKYFEFGSSSRGRRLRQIHNQVVRDGKIDKTESAQLADLTEMDEGAFRQVYDSDKNGVIEGGELKAVQLRVDRWVEYLGLTSIW